MHGEKQRRKGRSKPISTLRPQTPFAPSNAPTIPTSQMSDHLQQPIFSSTPTLSLPSSSSEVLMSALLTLSSPTFTSISRTLTADLRLLRSRLAFLLLSPPHFSRTLSYLHSLPLSSKALLIARLLLRSLLLLLPPLSARNFLPLLDLDAAVLLLAMCDSYVPSNRPADWHAMLVDTLVDSTLSISGLGDTPWAAVGYYVDAASKCRGFSDVVADGGVGKFDSECGVSAAAVVALPPAEGDGGACVVCREAMKFGVDVCGLPCGHRFHWNCAIRWLARRNTCPCCRFEMPTEDVLGEMRRLWKAVVGMSASRHACGGGLMQCWF